MFDANDHIQEIVRDLKLCDLVKEERDLLTQYNAALKSQSQIETAGRMKAEAGERKYRAQARRRLTGILIACGVVVLTSLINKP